MKDQKSPSFITIKNNLFRSLFLVGRFLRKNINYLVLFIFGVVVLTFVSKNSFLYPRNDWDDLNAFLTMGRGWGHGLIPYKDLFEQKGPVLYAIFYIAGLLSKTYGGIYLLECLVMFFNLIFLYKIAQFFLSKRLRLVFCYLSTFFLTLSPYFLTGGSAEEFMSPLILYGIYLIFRLQKNNFKISLIHYLFIGLSLGILFWTKYTMIGAFLGFLVTLIIVFLIKRRWKSLISSLTLIFLGFLTISLIIETYFFYHHALRALNFAYFHANIKLYQTDSDLSFFAKIIRTFVRSFKYMANSPWLLFFLIIGMLIVLFSRQVLVNNYSRLLYFASYLALILTTFIGGQFSSTYYYLILLPFATIPLGCFLTLYKGNINKFQNLLFAILSLLIILSLNENLLQTKFFPLNSANDLHLKTSTSAQKKFAHIIKHHSHPTLLNYNCLDMGMYQAAGVLPTHKYFEKQNIPSDKLPQMMGQQNRLIKQKKVDFVVTRIPYGQPISNVYPKLKQNYHLVSSHNQTNVGKSFTWLLYKKNNSALKPTSSLKSSLLP